MITGRFVCIEGIDGAGKSSIVRELSREKWPSFQGVKVIEKRDLSHGSDFEKRHLTALGSLLWEKSTSEPRHLFPSSYWLYLLASWFSLVGNGLVVDWLRDGNLVLSDGWVYKVLARFALKRDINQTLLQGLIDDIVSPDVVIFLDLDPKVAAEKKDHFGLSESGALDGYGMPNKENFIRYQSRVVDEYDKLRRSNWVKIDSKNGWFEVSDIKNNIDRALF